MRRSGAAPADVVLARRPDGGDWSKNDDGSLEWLTPTKGSPNLSLYSPATGYAPGGAYSVAPYGTTCSAFCAASGQSCDEAATQALAVSVGACEAAVTQLGLGWGHRTITQMMMPGVSSSTTARGTAGSK